MDSITVKVNKKCLPFGYKETKDGLKLHKFQEIFYQDIVELEKDVYIVVAPTGSGKTFSFSFPIRFAKDNNYLKSRRGLIVVPTNALAEDIERTLINQGIKVEVLTGNRLTKKGKDRGKELIDKLKKCEIAITNPDILNYMMNCGYHKEYIKDFSDWSEFFNLLDFIIFDEYHLYDEEQIANILIWFLLVRKFFKKQKWFFVSATPEESLLEIFKKYNIVYDIIEQPLESEGRVIQGDMEIEFIKISKRIEKSLFGYLVKNNRLREDIKNIIIEALSNKEKIMFIFDSLRDAMRFKYIIEREFNVKIWVNTGLQTREKKKEDLEKILQESDIIITTSKAEVGVNYPVSLCFMDSGPYLRNFMQRIGRVGRGKEKCKIYCTLDISKFKILEKCVSDKKYNYYEFVELMKKIFRDREFKKDKVPKFCGAVLWIILKSLEEYNKKETYKRRKILEELINSFPYYYVLDNLNKLINKIQEDDDIYEDEKKDILKWWETFKNSFKRFRGDSINWKVIYEDGRESEYDLIWLLDNAIVEIDKKNKTVIIRDYRDKRANVVRGIYTFSLLDEIYPAEIGGANKNEWFKFLYSEYIGDIFLEKLENWKLYVDDIETYNDIFEYMQKLSDIFTKKRIEIYDLIVKYDELEFDDII